MARTKELIKQVLKLWEAHGESFGQQRVYVRVLALFVGSCLPISAIG